MHNTHRSGVLWKPPCTCICFSVIFRRCSSDLWTYWKYNVFRMNQTTIPGIVGGIL